MEELLMYAQRQDVGAVGESSIMEIKPFSMPVWSSDWARTAPQAIPTIGRRGKIWDTWEGSAMPRMYQP
ncbi:MAG: hypothetical protein ACLVLH_22030 [Eisenbergiella massiliensis]